jgi:broad specificity phosphatase PhoE
MPTLILIKHSLPQIDPTVPANQWRLSEEGRVRARLLAQKLGQYSPDLIFSSVEPKAVETARIVGDALDKPVEVVEGLHEHARCNVKFLDKDKFEESVAQFFAQPDVLTFGNETADQAHHRFSQAVAGISAKYPNNNLALITHGTVLTLLVSRLAAVAPFPFWRDLELPSWVVLAHPDLELVKVFKSINAPE